MSYADDLAAVKQDGMALEFIKEQTPELCMEAVKQNGCAIQYVREQTPELCLAALKEEGEMLGYAHEDAVAATKGEGGSFLEYIKEQTPELCLAAIKQNIGALACVRRQTPELCLEALKQDGHNASNHIKDIEALKDYLKEHKEMLPLLLNYNEELTSLVKEIMSN